MKKNLYFLIGLCAAAGISIMACDDDDSNSSSDKSCKVASDCGDTSVWMCKKLVCTKLIPEVCTNGKTDDGETDADCGGICVSEAEQSKIQTCALGKICQKDTDCSSKYCNNNVCAERGCSENAECEGVDARCDSATQKCVSCSDNVTNGDETDVDCGGSCSIKCAVGKVCKGNGDCQSSVCTEGVCADVTTSDVDVNTLFINEFMAAPDSDALFRLNSDSKECKFVEVVNTGKEAVSLNGCSLYVKRTDIAKSSVTALDGNLASNSVLVVNNCKEGALKLPKDALSFPLDSPTSITSTGTYELYIECVDEAGAANKSSVVTAAKATTGISLNRTKDLSSESAKLIKHSALENSIGYASPGYCTNGGLFSEGCDSHCANKAMDGDETDIDCGGSKCVKCDVGKKCTSDSDCIYGKGTCLDGTCAAKECTKSTTCSNAYSGSTCDTKAQKCTILPTCFDSKLNQDESDIDCGGVCRQCDVGEKCKSNLDCTSDQCGTDGRCIGEPLPPVDYKKIFINEVMGSPNEKLMFGTQPTTPQCEFIEIVNTGDAGLMDNITFSMQKTDMMKFEDQSPTYIPLSGTIRKSGSLVVSACYPIAVPKDSRVIKKSLGIVNNAEYHMWLEDGVEPLPSHIIRDESSETGASQTRMTPTVADNTLVKHDHLSPLNSSPGYCNNGGLFSENCTSHCTNTVKDEDESDVNCGGILCDKCQIGQSCNADSDCANNNCDGGKCKEGTNPASLIINEVYDSSSSMKKPFPFNEGNDKVCEFVEIANPGPAPVPLKGLNLVLDGTDTKGNLSTLTIPLDSAEALPSRNLLVVHNCENLPLPNDVISLKDSKLKITGTWTYDISIDTAEKKSTQIKELAIGSNYKSSYNRSPDFSSDAVAKIIQTIDAAGDGVFATPGYCLNGGLYSESCYVESKKAGLGEACTGDDDCDGEATTCEDSICVQGCFTEEDCPEGYVCGGAYRCEKE